MVIQGSNGVKKLAKINLSKTIVNGFNIDVCISLEFLRL